MLLQQLDRRDDSRARCTAGNSSATSVPMIAITTNSSTSVNARTVRRCHAVSSCSESSAQIARGFEPANCDSQPAARLFPAHSPSRFTGTVRLRSSQDLRQPRPRYSRPRIMN